MKGNLLAYAMDMNPELFELDGIGKGMSSSGESGHSMKLSSARTPSPDSHRSGYSTLDKARRRTATTEELLYPMEAAGLRPAPLESVPETNGGSRYV